MIRSIWDFGSSLRNTTAADADEGLSRLQRPDKGGSDALCLGNSPCPRITTVSTDDHPSKSRIKLFSSTKFKEIAGVSPHNLVAGKW
jgi:hypothetical protein